ncbi:MAG: hypothetical protein RL172_1881 [Bacteroidota bacterium]
MCQILPQQITASFLNHYAIVVLALTEVAGLFVLLV